MRFEPAVLYVAVGDTVRWTNSDLVPHTVTSQAGVLDSGNLPPDSSWAVVVAGRGVLEYSCLYHTGMKGSIVAESMTRLRPRSRRDPANASVGAAEQFTKRNSRWSSRVRQSPRDGGLATRSPCALERKWPRRRRRRRVRHQHL